MGSSLIQPLSLSMLMVGAAVLIAVRLIYSRASWNPDDQVRLALRVIGWVLLAVSGLALLELLLGQFFGVLFWIVALLACGNMAHRYQQSEQTALLWMLAIAADRGMPLAPMIEAFGAEWGGIFGRRADRLAQSLRSGMPLPEALDRQPALLAGSARVATRVGVESGMLGPALREAVVARSREAPLWHSLAAKAYYLLVILFFGQLAIVQVAFYSVPRMEMILADFGIPPGELTQWTFDVLKSGLVLSSLIIALCIESIVLGYLLMHYLGWLPWGLPLVNRLTRRLDAALVLRSLAWMTQRERPISTAILAVARSYHKSWVRRRLRRADLHICNGVPWYTALESQHLLTSTEAAVLASAEQVGNLPWALREMAESGERRLAYRMQALVTLLYPVIIVALGIVTYVFVISILAPLITIIQMLSPA